MKKATKLQHWLQESISKWIPSEKPDTKKNEQEIMNLLFFSNFNQLSTADSISIFSVIKDKFEKEIALRKEKCQDELGVIRKFEYDKLEKTTYTVTAGGANTRVKEHVNNPVFDKPYVENIEVNYSEVEFIKKPKL